jgi:signal transduction histidine kinase
MDPNKKSVQDFLSIAIHDLREPVRAIRAGSEIIASVSRGSSDPRTVHGLQFINEGADRMEILIRNLAEFTNEELRDMDVSSVALDRALKEAEARISAECKHCGASIARDSLPVVKGDFNALSLVFRNLLDNACKFRGDAAPLIHVGATSAGSEWIISVRDNGVGFNREYRDIVFKPFERLNGKKHPGSGLGLTLAKRIVERHGGKIWAESSPGSGSEFSFSLPA